MQTCPSDHETEFEVLLAQYVFKLQPHLAGWAKAQAIEELSAHISSSGIGLVAAIERLRRKLGVNLPGRPTSFGDLSRACRDQDGGRLSVSEKRFVKDMCVRGFNFVPSERQRAWLESIFARLSARAA